MFSKVITSTCANVLPPPDPRCADPAFAAANPDICPAVPTLTIEPGVALVCALGSVQYRVIYTKAGIATDVTSSCIFNTSDSNIALVGAVSGNATGISQGIATISASYLDLKSYAQLTVLPGANCCAQNEVAMMVLIDTSRSMSLGFSAQYASRLSFAKTAATRFIKEVNITKDLVGLMTFEAADDNILSAPTSNAAAVAAMVPGIAQTQQKTSFFQALTDAIAQLSATGAQEQVIVLMSDGEDTTPSYGPSNNPITLLNDFKSSGGIVICLGCRASGKGFTLLDDFSTGGFLINAFPGNEQASLDYLSGLKGYICAGNCTPVGDTIAYKGQLNYSNFINFDVTGGSVDLQGNGFFDFLPGNGLYVDLAGTTPPQTGLLTSKNTFPIVAGHDYRLAVDLSGNQRVDASPESVRLRVYYLNNNNPVYLVDQLVTINDYTSPFTTYAFTFTAPAGHDVFISIQQEQQPTGGDPRIGLMLNRVLFQDTTTLTTLFDDNFDTENPTYIPPRCGQGTLPILGPDLVTYGYAYGYNCYGTGCLDQPPVVQTPDPNALPDIESGFTPPQEFSSTKTACVKCPDGFVNYTLTTLVPTMTSDTTPSGQAIASAEVVGNEAWRVFDNNTLNSDFWQPQAAGVGWVGYKFTAATQVAAYRIKCGKRNFAPSDFTFEGSTDGITWSVLDSRSGLNWFLGEFKDFLLSAPATFQYFRVNVSAILGGNDQPLNLRQLYLYPPVPVQACSTKSATSTVSQADADSKAMAAATADAQSQLNCVPVYSATEQYTAKCGPYCFGQDVTESASATSLNSLQEAQDAATAAAKALAVSELNCSGSNNDQKITINDAGPSGPQPATPYPSVQFVTGLVGQITKVTVKVKGFNHGDFNDVGILIRSPTGTVVELMRGVGGTNTPFDTREFDLVFDDAATNSVVPASATSFFLPGDDLVTLPITIYRKPTQGPSSNYPAPAPQVFPFHTTLAAFIGELPNGCWSLWVVDWSALDTGYMLFGFEVI